MYMSGYVYMHASRKVVPLPYHSHSLAMAGGVNLATAGNTLPHCDCLNYTEQCIA